MTVEVLSLLLDLTKIGPRLVMGCTLASTDVEAKIGGVDDRLEIADSGTIIVILLWLAVVTSATPVIVEPAALVVVACSFAVPRSSVVEDTRVLKPTEPT